MKASIFSTLLVLELASGTNFCDEKLRTSVTDAVELGNGTLLSTTDGVQYPNGTFWKEGEGSWAVCPCLFHSCIRVCEQGFANDMISHFGQNDVHETIYWNEIFEKNATLNDVFTQVPLAKCSEMADILEKDTFKIFANGQLKVENQTLHPEQYCVHFMDGSSVQVIRCMEEMIEEHQLKFILYPPFFVLSSIFLIWTAFAFVITPEIRSFHAKCLVCHSACMAVAFIALTVNYLHRITDYYKLCFTIGYTILYSFLASMFWLNAMSIDIYLTFKGFVRTQGSHIKKLTIYSFGTPMAIVAVAMTFNLVNSENSVFNAKIGE
ncbi:probable G-protein coupled receptor Mth-like 11 [Cloeon dipterum]|uniref:probable G-protein coupled receptor Mth-like 11 n=1 Tax=Cloeon dipterum TaxID=197152 RepID=UPI0032205223